MSATMLFVIGLGITFAISVGVVVYLKPALQRILTELCGTAERAAFWAAFSNVAIALVPLIFAMQYEPASGAGANPVFELVTELKWGLVGLVASVVVIGGVLSRFVPRVGSPQLSEGRGAFAITGASSTHESL